MRKSRTIRVFISSGLLLLFVLSIMPRVYLHDIFASHQDNITKVESDQASIVKFGYNCDINDTVATSPFTGTTPVIEIPAEIYFPVFHTRYTSQIATAAPSCFTLRGPPVLG